MYWGGTDQASSPVSATADDQIPPGSPSILNASPEVFFVRASPWAARISVYISRLAFGSTRCSQSVVIEEARQRSGRWRELMIFSPTVSQTSVQCTRNALMVVPQKMDLDCEEGSKELDGCIGGVGGAPFSRLICWPNWLKAVTDSLAQCAIE